MTTNNADIQDFLYPKTGHLWLQEWITHPFKNSSCTCRRCIFYSGFAKGLRFVFLKKEGTE